MSNKDFFELVKAIGESKSKQEEDRIIAEEVIFLKKKIPEVGTSKKKMKEYLIRSIYVEMLGQDASFAYIKAVELCASTNIIQKKAGYLAASLFLSPDHEFRFMLVNQIQRDMASSNYLEASAALSAITKIITTDTLPAILTPLVGLLSHANETIRKKTVTAMHRLHQLDPYCLQDHTDKIRRILCDKDPAVMGASLVLLLSLITADPYPYKDLVSSFISILKQITEHRLPREFDYHRIPAPWIQMHLLRILAVLGRGDQAASEGMYEVLVDVMRRADTGINVGYAIVYECVRTITSIYPNPLLLDAAATSISRFIRSEIRNLKYMGIKGLTAIVKEHVKYAADHQMAVIDCLEDPDETLKRKTLDLLYRMTNSVNVEFIVDKLLSFLASATDDHFRSDLVNRITQCAEKFASSHGWYVTTMVRVFYLAGDKIKSNVAQTLLQLIAEGEEEDDEEQEAELRPRAVEDFLLLAQKEHLPPILAEAVTWVLGEYGYLSTTKSKEEIMGYICNLCEHTPDITTIACGVTAMMKLVAQSGVCPPAVLEFVNMFSGSCNLDIMQRCLEFKQLLVNSGTMADVLPIDASCEDIQVDESLEFLDGFVAKALAAGASPYSPPNYNSDEDTDAVDITPGLKVNPYAKPTMPVAQSNVSMTTPAPSATMSQDAVAAAPTGLVLGKNVAQVWGKKVEPPPAVVPSPTPAAAPATPTPAAAPKPTTTTPPVAPAAAPSSPQQPREPTEREKMAAALFGGISNPSAATKRRSSATATWAPPAASSPVTAPAVTSSSPTTLPPAAPAPAPVAPAADMDLLDMGYTPAVASPTPVTAASSVFDSMTLTPTPVASSPATSPPPVPTSPSIDVFASLDNPTPSSTNLGAVSIFTPMVMTTRDFGGRWGHTPAESKQTVAGRTDVRTLDAVRAVVQQKGMHHVESIPSTNEMICAATLASPIVRATVGSLILLHIKLIPARNEVLLTVRTGSKDLTAECLGQLSAAFQQ